jgi:hypothetical protein
MGKTAKAPGSAAAVAPTVAPGFLVDRLGQIKAAKAALEMEEKGTKHRLVELVGTNTSVEGDAYRAAISHNVRESWDKELTAEAEALVVKHLSVQYITAHTKRTEFDRVDVSARTGQIDIEDLLARASV